MSPAKTTQTMKPSTAAKKLGIYLPAAPAEFRDAPSVSRAELARLIQDPPAWLRELRENGPHPREVVAARLGVSIAGLQRGGLTEALTTAEITELGQNPPVWLATERRTQRRVREEEERLEAQRLQKEHRAAVAAREAKAATPPVGDAPA